MNILRDELCEWVAKYNDRIAISYRRDDDVVDVSYRELVSAIFTLERMLRKDAKERVAIIGENSFQWFCYFYASILAGKQTLVCDMLLPLNEMSDVLRIMNVEKVFLSPELSGLDAELKSVNEALDVEFFKEERVEITDDADCEYEEGKILCTTSGTTAKAKGVVIGTEAFVNNNICLSQVMEGETGDCVYSPLPMHHMYGVNKTFAFLHKGARVCLGSMRRIEKDIEVFNPDRMLLVPTAVEFLYKRNRLDSRFKSIVVSGCKCEKRVEELCKKQGVFLQNIYGSSESAGGMALNVRENAIDELSVIPGREVEIASDGEILIKTPWLMDGYYHNQEATDK
ncbi:MAG: AMP-binding protein, partial [Lachnospiraceae bacterium]|nr:AMP-binding protein [Lachnospiraceae bacterium]